MKSLPSQLAKAMAYRKTPEQEGTIDNGSFNDESGVWRTNPKSFAKIKPGENFKFKYHEIPISGTQIKAGTQCTAVANNGKSLKYTCKGKEYAINYSEKKHYKAS